MANRPMARRALAGQIEARDPSLYSEGTRAKIEWATKDRFEAMLVALRATGYR